MIHILLLIVASRTSPGGDHGSRNPRYVSWELNKAIENQRVCLVNVLDGDLGVISGEKMYWKPYWEGEGGDF